MAGLDVTLRFEDKEARSVRIAHVRAHKRGLVARFAGIESANAAEELIGGAIWTTRANARLAKGEYFDEDLVGCRLVEGRHVLGTVTAVMHYPAQDVLEVDGSALVPMVGAFVREIDIAARVIRVELPPGLIEGEAL